MKVGELTGLENKDLQSMNIMHMGNGGSKYRPARSAWGLAPMRVPLGKRTGCSLAEAFQNG